MTQSRTLVKLVLVSISVSFLTACLGQSGSGSFPSTSPSEATTPTPSPTVTPTPSSSPAPTPTPTPVITKLYGYAGSQYTNEVYSFSIDKMTGEITATAGVSGAAQNASMISAVSFDKKYLVAANYSSHSVSTFSIAKSTGDLNLIGHTNLAASTNPAWITAHPSKRIFYSANAGNGTISIIDVDSNGAATVRSSIAAGSGVTCLAINNAGSVLYSVDQNVNQIGIYSVDSNGDLTFVSAASTPSGSQPNHAIISPNQSTLYVANWGTANVTSFSILSTSLTTIGDVSTGTGGTYMVSVSPDGKYLYASKPYAHSYSMHAIDATTGALSAATESTLSGSVNFSFWESFAFMISWSNGAGGLPFSSRSNGSSGISANDLFTTSSSYRGLYQLVLVEIEQ
jgi:6-phosphogluconolactonase